MKFDKQQFEDEVYTLAQSRVNAFFNALLAGDHANFNGDTLKMVRQFMDAMHFSTAENVIQIFHGINLFNEGMRKRKK